jgi:transcription termination factor Rho
MSDQTLERSVLERKERDELHTIAEALGVKPGTRTKKADLIDTILRAAGVEAAPEGGEEEKPKRAPRARKAATADDDAPALNGAAPATEEPSVNGAATEADVEPEPAAAAEEPNPEPELEAAAPATQDTPPAPVGDQPRQSNGHQQQRNQGNQPNQGNQGGGGGQPMGEGPGDGRRSRRRRGRDRDGRGGNDRDFRGQEQTAEQQYQGELIPVTGFLDLSDQGFGFLRTHGYLPYRDDVYVSVSQVRRFALRKGDHIEGAGRPPMGNEKYGALLRIDKVSGMTVEEAGAERL